MKFHAYKIIVVRTAITKWFMFGEKNFSNGTYQKKGGITIKCPTITGFQKKKRFSSGKSLSEMPIEPILLGLWSSWYIVLFEADWQLGLA